MPGTVVLAGVSLSFTAVHLALLIAIWAIIALRGRWFSAFSLVMAFLSAQYVGILSLSVKHGNFAPINTFAISMYALWLGNIVVPPVARQRETPYRQRTGPQAFSDWLVFSLLFALVIYRFSAGGIPLLSDNLIVERFDTTASGLFGIPERVVLYSLPFFVLGLSAKLHVHRLGKWQAYRGIRSLSRLAWITFLASMVLSGFKSSVLNVLVVWALAQFAARSAPSVGRSFGDSLARRAGFAATASIGVVLAFMAVAALSQLYPSIRSTPSASYVVERATEIAGGPFFHIVDSFVPQYGAGARYLLNDIGYFTDTIVHWHIHPGFFNVSWEYANLTTTKLVSADMWHRPLDRFQVPITTTIFGYLYLLAGRAGAIGGALLFGSLLALLDRLQNRYLALRNFNYLAVVIFAEWFAFTVAVKGNPVYLGVNFAFGALIVLSAQLLARAVIHALRQATGGPSNGFGRRA